MALLPPNSKIERPNLLATFSPTALPINVDPVAETTGILLSWLIFTPIFLSPVNMIDKFFGRFISNVTSFHIF